MLAKLNSFRCYDSATLPEHMSKESVESCPNDESDKEHPIDV